MVKPRVSTASGGKFKHFFNNVWLSPHTNLNRFMPLVGRLTDVSRA